MERERRAAAKAGGLRSGEGLLLSMSSRTLSPSTPYVSFGTVQGEGSETGVEVGEKVDSLFLLFFARVFSSVSA